MADDFDITKFMTDDTDAAVDEYPNYYGESISAEGSDNAFGAGECSGGMHHYGGADAAPVAAAASSDSTVGILVLTAVIILFIFVEWQFIDLFTVLFL